MLDKIRNADFTGLNRLAFNLVLFTYNPHLIFTTTYAYLVLSGPLERENIHPRSLQSKNIVELAVDLKLLIRIDLAKALERLEVGPAVVLFSMTRTRVQSK